MRFWPRKNQPKFKVAVRALFLILLLFTVGFLIKNFSRISFQLVDQGPTPIVFQSPQPEEAVLEQGLASLGIEIKSPLIETGADIIATFSSGTTLLVKKENDYSKTLASLQLILKNIRIEGKWPLKIDLRFRRPVLSY